MLIVNIGRQATDETGPILAEGNMTHHRFQRLSYFLLMGLILYVSGLGG